LVLDFNYFQWDVFSIYAIEEIKGVGSKIIDKILECYSSYENFEESIRAYEIDKLMSIPGLSRQKALEIARFVLNKHQDEFLKTTQAETIYQDIINRILTFTNTEYARNRVLLLTPTTDYDEISKRNEIIMKTLNNTKNLDYDYIRKLYQNITPLNTNCKAKFNDTYAILCEDYEDYMELLERGLNKYCNIYPLENNTDLNEYEYIIYIYNDFNTDPGETSNIITVSNKSPDYEIQPAVELEFYRQNRPILENVFNLRKYLNLDTCIDKVLETLDEITVEKHEDLEVTGIIEDIKDKTDKQIEQQIKQIDLSGEEVLQLLNNENLPPKIMTIFNKQLDIAKDEIKKQTGIYIDPFIIKYPLEIDYDEIKRVQENNRANHHIKQYEKELNACVKLEKFKEKIIEETTELIHYDYQFSLAHFSKYYNLTIPNITKEYVLEGALHLTLKQQEHEENLETQPINYNLDDDNNIILLTGANSGGKTTLLETLAQHTIMTHMGLGVCSKTARIAQTSEVYYFTKKHSLNAGAFETFLTSFIPVVVGRERKLILIDELESITELEAAIKIIIGFIEHIQDKQSYAIIVTHMASEILKHTNDVKIRTDGIEAKGLDKDYNLIVDRSPRINYLANSTPELILTRVYEKSEEPIKSVYKDILDKFKD